MLKKISAPLVFRAPSGRRFKNIIFIDRDGVINRFPGIGFYVTRLKDFHLLPGALTGIRRLSEAGFEVNVVSNQGCIAHRFITSAALRALTRRMFARAKRAGGTIQDAFYCPHQTSDRCDCKKPGTLLFKKALRGRKFDVSKIYFVGDSKEDVKAAKNFGCRSLLVLSGRTKKKDLRSFRPKPDVVKKNLLEAARWITRKKS